MMEKKSQGYILQKASDSTTFPAEFLMRPENEVVTDQKAGGMKGYIYEGLNGEQLALWVARDGKAGYCEPHSHDYGEYCHVLSGEYRLVLDGVEVCTLKAGDELYMEPGVVHSGWYTGDYRAIDGFEQRRFKRCGDK